MKKNLLIFSIMLTVSSSVFGFGGDDLEQNPSSLNARKKDTLILDFSNLKISEKEIPEIIDYRHDLPEKNKAKKKDDSVEMEDESENLTTPRLHKLFKRLPRHYSFTIPKPFPGVAMKVIDDNLKDMRDEDKKRKNSFTPYPSPEELREMVRKKIKKNKPEI